MEMELRQRYHEMETEDLIGFMILSWLFKNRHFYGYPEIARRMGYAIPIALYSLSNLMIDGSAAAGKEVVKTFT